MLSLDWSTRNEWTTNYVEITSFLQWSIDVIRQTKSMLVGNCEQYMNYSRIFPVFSLELSTSNMSEQLITSKLRHFYNRPCGCCFWKEWKYQEDFWWRLICTNNIVIYLVKYNEIYRRKLTNQGNACREFSGIHDIFIRASPYLHYTFTMVHGIFFKKESLNHSEVTYNS